MINQRSIAESRPNLERVKSSAESERGCRYIATEEAFATDAWFAAMDRLPIDGPEKYETRFLNFVQGFPQIRQGLLDIEHRLETMNRDNVAVHLLSLTTPGVQAFAGKLATEMARALNDYLADIIRRYPGRFAGLAAVAPQDPDAAAKEIERAMTDLRLNGVIINSYTNDEFLDLPKFDPILAAAARIGAPIYLHPRVPAPSMVEPYTTHGLLAALWGFSVDTGLHAMRLIMSGVFDRYPNLTIVLGHMGEGIPYWFWRIDNMYKKFTSMGAGHVIGINSLKKLPSEYFRENFYITTSGMNCHDSLEFGIKVMGSDRIMFAIDFPYESSSDSVRFLDSAPISKEDKEKIAYKNAERVFGIG